MCPPQIIAPNTIGENIAWRWPHAIRDTSSRASRAFEFQNFKPSYYRAKLGSTWVASCCDVQVSTVKIIIKGSVSGEGNTAREKRPDAFLAKGTPSERGVRLHRQPKTAHASFSMLFRKKDVTSCGTMASASWHPRIQATHRRSTKEVVEGRLYSPRAQGRLYVRGLNSSSTSGPEAP